MVLSANFVAVAVDDDVGTSAVSTQTPENAQSPATPTTPKISKEEAAKKLAEAKEKYNKAKENEQSFANRALGATSSAATGLGAMQLAEGIAEQNADRAAEEDMNAYIATMKCTYGKGQEVELGNQDVTLPGGNELVNLYTEYKQTAERLKATKKALGLRAGIENEVLYDKAQTGLYQNASVGRVGGGYTSLYNALTDETGADAAAWASQKDISAQKRTAGALAVVGGTALGIGGNLLINGLGGDDDNGTDLSDLDNINPDAINSCPYGQVRQNGICVCTNGKDVSNNCQDPETDDQEADVTEKATQCPTGKTKDSNGNCVCEKDSTADDCRNNQDSEEVETPTVPENKSEDPNKPQFPNLDSIIESITNAEFRDSGTRKMFDSGEYRLNIGQINDLDRYIDNIVKVLQKPQNKDIKICVTITGHTDRVPVDQAKHKNDGFKNNAQLSALRAKSVAEYFKSRTQSVSGQIKSINARGMGSEKCPSTYAKDAAWCRSVEIEVEKCEGSTTPCDTSKGFVIDDSGNCVNKKSITPKKQQETPKKTEEKKSEQKKPAEPKAKKIELEALKKRKDNCYYNHGNNAHLVYGHTYDRDYNSDSDPNWCRNVEPGGWGIKFEKYNVFGTSACSSTPGTPTQVTDTIQNHGTGKYCWCKMTSPGVSAWVLPPTGAKLDDVNRCSLMCAGECTIAFTGNAQVNEFVKAMIESIK